MRRNLSLRTELMLLLGVFVLIATVSLGTMAYKTARTLIERSAVNEVGIAANARERALNQLLDRQRARAQALIKTASLDCAPDEIRCLRRMLANFVVAEGARAVRLSYRGRAPITAGPTVDTAVNWIAPDLPQAVRFEIDEKGQPYYLISAAETTRDGPMQITLQGDLRVIDPIFLDRSGLGRSGETFLTNRAGQFLTPPRYPVAKGAVPVTTKALNSCETGTNGEVLDLDYRGVPAVRAFRHIPEIDGICVFALIDQAEAFAPTNKLREDVAGVSGGLGLLAIACSFLFAQLVTRPMERLRERTRSLESGDFDSPVPMGGPAEVQTFAQTFAAMASSLKESRATLQETNERIRNILESTSDSFVAVDRQWRCTYVNAKAASLCHLSVDQLLGKDLRNPFLSLLSPFARSSLLQSMEDRAPAHFEEYYEALESWFEVDAYPTQDGLAIFGRDVTARKLMSDRLQQTQKLESLGVLAGGIAHDFNNLLTGIMGNASLVLDELAPDDPKRQSLENVVSGGERAAALTRQLLAYAGKGRFLIQPLDLSDLVRKTISLLNTSIPRTVELQLDMPEGLPPIQGDSSQVQQLIMNLVINAAEAIGEEKSGTVRVVTGVGELNQSDVEQNLIEEPVALGSCVTLAVHDTGCGMDENTIRRVFDPFFTTKFAGRGLGLAAATGIVRGHKGTMRVRSAPGKGSSFEVFFPALPGETPASEPAVVNQSPFEGTGTILVIDDEDSVRRAAQSILERYGYRVILAEGGKAGIDLFAKMSADIGLVLLDLTMPVMSGEETLERLKAIRIDVRIIVASGYNETEATRRLVGQELAGFIQKPFTSTSLAQQVRAALGDGVRDFPSGTP